MTPVCDDPKFDGATPATTAFVDKPKARTRYCSTGLFRSIGLNSDDPTKDSYADYFFVDYRSEMFQQRKTQNLNEMAQTLEVLQLVVLILK